MKYLFTAIILSNLLGASCACAPPSPPPPERIHCYGVAHANYQTRALACGPACDKDPYPDICDERCEAKAADVWQTEQEACP